MGRGASSGGVRRKPETGIGCACRRAPGSLLESWSWPPTETEACAGGRRQLDDAGVTLPAHAPATGHGHLRRDCPAPSPLLCGKRVEWAELSPSEHGHRAAYSLLHRCAPTHLLACTHQDTQGVSTVTSVVSKALWFPTHSEN